MRFGGLIAAVVVAAIAAVIVLRMSGSSAPIPVAATPEAKSVNVYVATKPLPVGTTIAETDIGVQPWPENLVLDGFVQADSKASLIGMVTRASIQQSEPLTASKVANPNDPNFLAGDLPKGMRVITIPVNETDGVAGFIFPGDHVDMIYTHDIQQWVYPPFGGDTNKDGVPQPEKVTKTVTETLLTNVKVLALDQRSAGANAVDSKGNLLVPRAASLMVSAVDSQRVRLANKTGTISLVLRSLADKESADPLVLTTEKDISQSRDTDGDSPGGVDHIKIQRGAPRVSGNDVTATVSRGAAATNGVIAVPADNANVIGNPNISNNNTITTPSAANQ